MDPFNRKKIKKLAERLLIAEAQIKAMRNHMNILTQSSLYLSKLIQGVTTQEMQIAARDEAEEAMGQAKQLIAKTTGDQTKADELWNRYGKQDLSRMDRLGF